MSPLSRDATAEPIRGPGFMRYRQYRDGGTIEATCKNCKRVIYIDDEGDWRHRVNDWMLCERVPA